MKTEQKLYIWIIVMALFLIASSLMNMVNRDRLQKEIESLKQQNSELQLQIEKEKGT